MPPLITKEAQKPRLYISYHDLKAPIQHLYHLPTSPEFFFVEEARRQHRSWGENLTFYTGWAYLDGAIGGARTGLISGIKSFESSYTLKFRVNRILNYSDHLGQIWGNRLGVIRLLYTGLESEMVSFRDTDDAWNSVAAGLRTGSLYQAARGVNW
ncbi:hypothetical protein UlMin_026115 [Ulmus minor]